MLLRGILFNAVQALSMKRRSYVMLCIGGSFLLFFSSGCVYLRLLKLQQQFGAFAEYMKIDTNYGISMAFLHPVLYARDIAWLMKGEPAIQAHCGRYTVFKYEFPKQYTQPGTTEPEALRVALMFVFREEKLISVRLPKEFSRVIHPQLLESSLRSMGGGTVDKGKREIAGQVATDELKKSAPIPNKPDVEKILGVPYATIAEKNQNTLYYQYGVNLKADAKRAASPLIDVWFSFSAKDDTLKKAKFSFNNLTAAIDFS